MSHAEAGKLVELATTGLEPERFSHLGLKGAFCSSEQLKETWLPNPMLARYGFQVRVFAACWDSLSPAHLLTSLLAMSFLSLEPWFHLPCQGPNPRGSFQSWGRLFDFGTLWT